jgi:hypothetical protein
MLTLNELYIRPRIVYPKLFNLLEKDIKKNTGNSITLKTSDDIKKITNLQLRDRSSQALNMSNVDHRENHIKVWGLCMIGGFVYAHPFSIALLIYSGAEVIYTLNEIRTIQLRRPLFDYKKYQNIVNLYMMGIGVLAGISILTKIWGSVGSRSTEIINK